MKMDGIITAMILGVVFRCVDGTSLQELQSRGWNVGGSYNTGPGGAWKAGGEIGYSKGGWNVKGSGWRDHAGKWGAGVSVGYSWKRASRVPKDPFVLRLEANPCQFAVYDEDSDGIITIEEMKIVFPDEKLANDLFMALDTDGDGEIPESEFSDAVPKVIVGCGPPPKNEERK